MTATLLAPADISSFEFHIPCEWREYECPHPATVMSQGCTDDRPYAICNQHLDHVKKFIAAHKWHTCDTCSRPFLHFETHYDVMSIAKGPSEN